MSARVQAVCEDPGMTAAEDTQARSVSEDRIAELLSDAGEFFEAYL